MHRLEVITECIYGFGFFIWLYATWRQTQARRYYEKEAKRMEELNRMMYETIARNRKNAEANQ